MPLTREDHIVYTRKELTTYPYYIDVIETLRDNKISSYLDIGANIGEYCNVLFDKIQTLTEAHLIEPESENFEFMKNHVKPENVSMYNVGIGYGFSRGRIVKHWSNNVGGFMINADVSNGSVQVSTLEELKLPIVDMVKIDIEGGEFNLIENSSYLQEIKWIELEFHIENSAAKKEETMLYLANSFPKHIVEILEPNLYARVLLRKI